MDFMLNAEAQHATMTQTYTVMYNTNSEPINAISKDLFRRHVSETPADLGQVTGKLRANKLDIE